MLEKIENFSRAKKSMFLLIREGFSEALLDLSDLHIEMQARDMYLKHFEYYLRDRMDKKIKKIKTARSDKDIEEGCQTAPQPTARCTSGLRKRPRKLIVSPTETAAKKPEEKKQRASTKEEEWVEVLARKKFRKQNTEKDVKISNRPKRAHPEAVFIKPAEKVSYTTILKDLKRCAHPSGLG